MFAEEDVLGIKKEKEYNLCGVWAVLKKWQGNTCTTPRRVPI